MLVALLGEVDLRGEGTVSRGVVGQGEMPTPHLVVGRPDRDQVPSRRQRDRLPVLVAFPHDRAVALRRHVLRKRILRLPGPRVDEAGVVDVDDVVEVRQRGVRAEVPGVHSDRAAGRRARRGRLRRGGRPGQRHDRREQADHENGDRHAGGEDAPYSARSPPRWEIDPGKSAARPVCTHRLPPSTHDPRHVCRHQGDDLAGTGWGCPLMTGLSCGCHGGVMVRSLVRTVRWS
jgi:hypothetical protein